MDSHQPVWPIRSLVSRFWSRVDASGGLFDCWPWTGAIGGAGYGVLMFERARLPAHRLSWELANSAVFRPGFFACHTCDYKLCVNPAHVWPGDARDNAVDYHSKRRPVVNAALAQLYRTNQLHDSAVPHFERWAIQNRAILTPYSKRVASSNAKIQDFQRYEPLHGAAKGRLAEWLKAHVAQW